jgi:hypothetical protein
VRNGGCVIASSWLESSASTAKKDFSSFPVLNKKSGKLFLKIFHFLKNQLVETFHHQRFLTLP